MKFLLNATALLAGLLAAAPAARAQDPSVPYFNMIDAATSANLERIKMEGILGAKGAATASSRKPVASASLAYAAPAAALKARTVADFTRQLRLRNLAAADAIAAGFGPGKADYDQLFRGLISNSGLRENDAVDVLAAYMLTGYTVAADIQDATVLRRPAAPAVRAQLAAALASDPAWRAPGAAARFGESLKLQTVLLNAAWRGAVEKNTAAAFRQTITALFKNQYHIDLSILTLTDQGFARKGA